MKIKADKKVVNLDGKEYKTEGKDLTVGMVVAEALAASTAGGKMKTFALAQKFWNGSEVEADEADAALVKAALEACNQYNAIILGQVLLEIEGSK